LEVDRSTGLFLYRLPGVTVPRQSGKTTGVLSLCCHRGMAWNRQTIVYAAQNGTWAKKKWEDDQLPVLAAAGFVPGDGEKLLPRHRARVRKAHGSEAIIWRKTRSIHGLHSNTEQSGHGPTLHLGVADEFFAQVDDRISAAWSPAMITVLMAQLWWFSTMGTSRSVPMNAAVKAGRELVQSGAPSRTAYFDWSAPPGADRSDPRVWLGCMPALCLDPVCRCSPDRSWTHTVTMATIQAELDAATTPAKLAEFDRAYLNQVRDDDQVEADPLVPSADAWELLADATAGRGPTLAIAIDVTPSADAASVSAVGEGPDGPEGPPRGVLLEHGPGIEWVVPYVVAAREELKPVAVVLDEKSRARELLAPLVRAKIRPPKPGKEHQPGDLWIPTTPDVGAACARWSTVVNRGWFVHTGQERVKTAVAGLRSRSIGDGLFAFARKVSSVDISPAYTFALALAGYERFRHLAADYDLLDSIPLDEEDEDDA
jgi:hypothetical protein